MRPPKAGLAERANKPGDSRLSAFTVGYAIYIVISASFMQQVWQFLTRVLGKHALYLLCGNLYLFLAVIICLRLFKSRLHFLRVIASIIILALSFLFAWRQPFFVEKMHVAEYGFLGWLVMEDLRRRHTIGLAKAMLFSILFILLVGSIDEGFQKLLPYRVGEIRDVITNVISGLSGIVLFFLADEKHKIGNNKFFIYLFG